MDKFFRIPFAESGDLAPVPDDLDVTGEVSYTQGYGPDYSLDPGLGGDAKRIERDQYNQILLSATKAIQEQQTKGMPDHITSALNDGAPFAYEIGATVFQPIDDKIYRNIQAANTNVPPGTGWIDITTPLTSVQDGTLSQKGVVQLSNTRGTSNTLAATPNLVKENSFDSTTAMLFMQASAPTGWTKSVTHNNKALRIVSGAGGGSGGSVAFTTVFGSARATTSAGSHSHGGNTGAVTLTAAQSGLPSHSHTFVVDINYNVAGSRAASANDVGATQTATTNSVSAQNASSSHAHTISSDGSHSHTTDLAVQYVDAIVCTKD